MSNVRRNCLSILILALLVVLTAAAVQAQDDALGEIRVESGVDKSTMTIGELVTYSVRAIHTPDVQVIWPSLASNLGAFEIRDYLVHEPDRQGDEIVEKIEYTISTFDTGAYVIPPIILEYRVAGDSASHRLQTEPLEIYVRSLKPSEEGDIRGLKPQAVIPRDWKLLMLYIAAGVLSVGLIWALVWYFKFRKKGEPLFARPQEPPRPAHEVAIEALQQLEQEQLFEKGEVKRYFSRLADILRVYLRARFDFDAMEMTTREITEQLTTLQEFPDLAERVSAVLKVCDLAKFAKYRSSVDESRSSLTAIRDIVESTRPKPILPEEADGRLQRADGREKAAEETSLVGQEEETAAS